MNIKRGDNVIVISGKDKGKKGKIIRALPKRDAVVIEGVNIKKRHQKARKSGGKGQILEIAAPINVSNIMLVDSKTDKPTRISMRMEKGKKIRISKKSGVAI